MEIEKPKSHSPVVHDNTEEDLILVPPSVLENKLESFEHYSRASGTIGSDIALAITFIVPLLTSADFKSFGPISGATIQGAFYIGAIVVLIKIVYGYLQIKNAPVKSRGGIVHDLLVKKDKKYKRPK